MGIFGGVQGLNILMSIVRNKVVAVLLGTAGMGLISLFNATVRLVSDSTNLGLSMSAVRELSAAYEQGDEERLKHRIQIIRMWVALTAIAGMLLCILLSPLLNRFTFSWGNHTLHFIALSPTIAFLALAAGETAILKATRQLRQLALQSVYGVLGALLTSVALVLCVARGSHCACYRPCSSHSVGAGHLLFPASLSFEIQFQAKQMV